MNIYEELQWRGLVATATEGAPERLGHPPLVTGKELNTQFVDAAPISEKPVTLYCGFDPTADSLHVGNLVPLLALRRFQLLGHHPIAVAGGATGSIGDPSGKTAERQLLTAEILDHNIASVKVQLAKLLDFETKQNPARLVDNASWTKGISFLDFLRDIGKHFSVNQMVAKESVRARMEDREVGISYTEFSYMLLQAFDFTVLCREQNCELQIGGSDQWGNITAGIELTRKKLGKQVFGLTLPLITNADGSKFGKSVVGAVWLDKNRTKEEDFYQFWIRTDDRDVVRYLKYFTFLSHEEIAGLEAKHIANPAAREAHKALAQAVTSMIHPQSVSSSSSQQADSPVALAERASKILFGKLFPDYTLEDWEFLAKHWHSIEVEKTRLVGMPLVELLVLAGLSPSKGQARKDIEENNGKGICINNNPPLPNWSYHIQPSDLHPVGVEKYIRLRKGKKNYAVVIAK